MILFCQNLVLKLKSETKWSNELNLPETFNWNYAYNTPFKTTRNSKLHWLQYRINHRILGANQLLHKIGIKNDNSCSFCNTNTETLSHLFYECQYTDTFWMDVKNWINPVFNIPLLQITKLEVLLGHRKLSSSVNVILLLGKKVIMSSKSKRTRPNLNQFIMLFRNYIACEKFHYSKEGRLDALMKMWRN
ncbi:hypothetical protein ACF0H5_019607 [Mactra antiquata]